MLLTPHGSGMATALFASMEGMNSTVTVLEQLAELRENVSFVARNVSQKVTYALNGPPGNSPKAEQDSQPGQRDRQQADS